MTRDALIELLASRDPLQAARAAGVVPRTQVRVMRGPCTAPVVDYGRGNDDGDVADRLLALARDGATAVAVRPAASSESHPGSWGVEDLVVIAAARALLPDAEIEADWDALGASGCQVAVAFGLSAWRVPDGDDTDLAQLADAVGCRVVEGA